MRVLPTSSAAVAPAPSSEPIPNDTENAGELLLLLQQWEESEREAGWGVTVRPDGYSAHRTPAALEAYLQAYWEAMPDKSAEGVPDCYSRPSGDPVAVKVALDHPLALALAARDSRRLLPWDDDTKEACWAAEHAWHALAPGRGWHVDRDWPKLDDKGKA